MEDAKKIRRQLRSSIRGKTAGNLIILSFVTIACFWIAQILIYNFATQAVDSYMLTSIGREMIDAYRGYPSPEFRNQIKSYADRYGANITFFSANIDYENNEVMRTYVIYAVSPFSENVLPYGAEVLWNDEQFSSFFVQRIFKNQTEFTYALESPPALVFGAEFVDIEHEMTIFAYVEAYRSVSGLNFANVLIQLVAASLICIFVAVLLALIYSRQFSDPIIAFSRAAESLAKGKFRKDFGATGIKEIDSLGSALNYAATEIKKTDDFRKEFLANITHDLRTPITMMRGYAEMIRDISGDNKQKRNSHAQIIIDESERLSLLVEDILLMSKLDAGTLTLNKTSFDVSSLASTIIERFKIKTLKESYIFFSDLTPELMIFADMQRIEQVLYNLIANAVNYTGSDKKVLVKTRLTAQGKARIEISDTGKGIAPEDIDLIWDRYYRINQNTRKVIGNGIGLNIVKGILNSHAANFGVESTLGTGTTFWLEL